MIRGKVRTCDWAITFSVLTFLHDCRYRDRYCGGSEDSRSDRASRGALSQAYFHRRRDSVLRIEGEPRGAVCCALCREGSGDESNRHRLESRCALARYRGCTEAGRAPDTSFAWKGCGIRGQAGRDEHCAFAYAYCAGGDGAGDPGNVVPHVRVFHFHLKGAVHRSQGSARNGSGIGGQAGLFGSSLRDLISLLDPFPALKRWAKLCRPCGAWQDWVRGIWLEVGFGGAASIFEGEPTSD